MKERESANGTTLRDMFSAGTSWLEKMVPDIDALNVFPVPDGDTGTNMLLTMRSCLEEGYRAPDRSASAVAEAMAKGALMGARGNSGVILSQIWRGLAQGLAKKETFTGKDFAEALEKASKMAYKGLSNPVEGTILTVAREAAAAAKKQAAGPNDDLVSVVEAAVQAAGESVARTPTLLPVLREAGVVDAGGQGLYTLLEGTLHYLKGESDELQFRKPWLVPASVPMAGRAPQTIATDEVPYGYCTEFMLKGEKLDMEKLRSKLEKRGESLIVVGGEGTVRVHIHTLDPGAVLHYVGSMGTLHQINIRNMDEQHQDFLEMQKERTPTTEMSIVAVAAGEGLTKVFQSLGVGVVVPGGQTMNPSTKDILQAVETVPSEKVIVLPNNKNIILTAKQAQTLTKKHIAVIAAETVPQGVAALLAFDYEADFDANVQRMEEARCAVKTIEITRAIRSTKVGGLKIKRKQAIGLLDGELMTVGDSTADALDHVLAKIDMDKAEVVTIYYGADTEAVEAEKVSLDLRERHPNLQVDVIQGGQPHYNYIVSVE